MTEKTLPLTLPPPATNPLPKKVFLFTCLTNMSSLAARKKGDSAMFGTQGKMVESLTVQIWESYSIYTEALWLLPMHHGLTFVTSRSPSSLKHRYHLGAM